MRDESLEHRQVDALDMAAAWPSSAQVAPLPIPESPKQEPAGRFTPAAAAPDLPVAAGAMIVAAYVSLVGALAVATVAPGQSLFAIAIAGFFLFMFFSVPAMFLGVEGDDARRPSLARFLDQGMQTLTGHNSGRAALVQMLLVPVALTFGVIGIGIAIALIG
jgi:hypothetical protein